jgi:hypothetical protein
MTEAHLHGDRNRPRFEASIEVGRHRAPYFLLARGAP